MSLFSLGCLGLIIALLGAAVLAPLLLVAGQDTQIEAPPYDYQGTNEAIETALQATFWQLSTQDAQFFSATPLPTWTLASSE